ncbi:hypothetical protein SAMN05216388_100238 [Halorientalis persicus]|jgi:hypothetical protein|uniref:Uncharacterized protein n=1 Tax=Halorientalis persicus TaxID=1367881 RepID=A0A1H8EMD9_9EURY|nr:hypothetical protein [Halorientalis persicus]SEN19958.1 hypothetical protein SAMN05216388_100238 [Halorientalis persicus]
MTDEQYQELLQLVRGRAGEAFRAALKYDQHDCTMLYIRDDVATQELRDALDTLVDRARNSGPVAKTDVYRGIGETQAIVELHERAALIHLRETSNRGVIVSLDRDIAQGLGNFVTRCNGVLSGN